VPKAAGVKIDVIRILLPLQIGAACCALVGFALAPPAQGRMLLIPMLPDSGHHLAADVIARGARLEGVGPFAGSLVIDGTRDRVTPGLLGRGVLTLSTNLFDCGTFPEKSR
jgi:hypothetical protein